MAQAMAKEKFFFSSLYVLSPLHCEWLRKKRKGANSNEAESFCGNIYILIILHICVYGAKWAQDMLDCLFHFGFINACHCQCVPPTCKHTHTWKTYIWYIKYNEMTLNGIFVVDSVFAERVLPWLKLPTYTTYIWHSIGLGIHTWNFSIRNVQCRGKLSNIYLGVKNTQGISSLIVEWWHRSRFNIPMAQR